MKAWISSHYYNISETHTSILLILFYVLLTFSVTPEIFWGGRFWAEEGRNYFIDLRGKEFHHVLLFYYQGYLALYTNIGVYISTLLPLRYAPLATTYLGFFVQSLPVLLVILYRNALNIKPLYVFGFVIIVSTFTHSHEVWANLTNSQTHFLVLSTIILLLKPTRIVEKLLFRSLLFIGALSGVPASFVTPLFVWKAFKYKDRESVVQAVVVSIATLIQIIVVGLSYTSGARNLEFDFTATIFSASVQHIATLFFGQKAAHLAATLIIQSFNHWPIKYALLCIAAATIFGLYKRLLSSRRESILYLLLGALIAIVASVALCAGPRVDLISAYAGGRYFYAPNFFLVLSMVLYLSHSRDTVVLCIFTLCVFTSIFLSGSPYKGPDWNQSLDNSLDNNLGTIQIWPYDWTMRNPYYVPETKIPPT